MLTPLETLERSAFAFGLVVLLLVLANAASGCTDESGAREKLEGLGFTAIEFTGYSWFGCAEGDTTATEFVATGPTGKRIEGVVCCGLIFKACTVRF